MNVRLKAEQVALIQEMIHAGHFCVPEEAIEAAVWLLKDAYELHKVKRDELRKLIAVGVEQADRGELIDADVVFRQLAEKIEKRLGATHMNGLQFTPEAVQDLDDIYDYITQANPVAATRVVQEIQQRCQTVGQFPGLGRPRDDLQPGLRSFPSGKYVIFFRAAAGGGAQIVRILHGARDFSSVFGNP